MLVRINSFSGNYFDIHGHYVRDIWLQLHVKFEDFVINSFRDNSAETISTFKVTLNFDIIVIPKLIGVIYLSWQIILWNMKTKWRTVFKTMSGNNFAIQGHCDLWPTDPKINRGHLLVMTNLHVKYEAFVIYSFQDNQRKPF